MEAMLVSGNDAAAEGIADAPTQSGGPEWPPIARLPAGALGRPALAMTGQEARLVRHTGPVTLPPRRSFRALDPVRMKTYPLASMRRCTSLRMSGIV